MLNDLEFYRRILGSLHGSVAQLVEQRLEEPCVHSSSLCGATRFYKKEKSSELGL